KQAAQYMVVPAPAAGTNPERLHTLLSEASAAGKVEILAEVLKRATDDADVFRALLERAAKDPQAFAEAAAALNLAACRAAVAELEGLIAADAAEEVRESKFQDLL